MKIAIIGSRDFKHLERVKAFIDTLPKDTIIISGGARGVDKTAEEYAALKGMQVLSIRPVGEGKQYYLYRDIEIVTMAESIVAFWDGVSRGTKFTLDYARGRMKRVAVIGDE